MAIKQSVYQLGRAVYHKIQRPFHKEIVDRLRIASPQEKAAAASQASGALADLFFRHQGRIIHKWIHYLEIYERYFAPYRSKPIKFLEIGVYKGGSLELWREYFGESATIFGIDVDPECVNHVTLPNQVRIGSQDDHFFLQQVINEMGVPDIVLDDGSHLGRHQRKSFDVLFPMLKPGALYVIEDLHTSYWRAVFKGGHGRQNTAIGHIKQMIDDMHAWYHHNPTTTTAKTDVGAIHIHDSIVVIEKAHRAQPGHIKVG
jgi:hypothetical protein